MAPDLGTPDFEASVPLDPYAPSFARFCVGRVDSPSPDLRDATALLASELVSRAVEASPTDDHFSLQIWMPSDVVRVEITVGGDFAVPQPGASAGRYGVMLLEQIADRWSVDRVEDRVSAWFEIDRHPTARQIGRDRARAGAPAAG
jgi:hypothetical protein